MRLFDCRGPLLAAITLLTGLAHAQPPAAPVSYQQQIQPIFEHKCLACHGCYDAPCQLKLEAGEGLDRGASKARVYGTRTEPQAPTRLFEDAMSTDAWRDKGFFSVLDSAAGAEQSLLFQMLALGRQTQFAANSRLPDNIPLGMQRENTCPNLEEFDKYARKHPKEGMPLAVTGLTDQEYDTLLRWFQQGAPVAYQNITLSAAEQRQIQAWEALLNQPGPRHQLVARWLYEHLFLAHLYFADGSGQRPANFFKLYRSSTPPGQALEPVAAVRPNDPPPAQFWYRLVPVRGSIVHKTHITFPLSDAKLARTREQFFADDWKLDTLPGYGYEQRANPFTTFAAIPAKARYQFMLDEAEYFVRTFIRGPVCRGQIATDVIRDQFWAAFQDPAHDLFVTDTTYQQQVSPLLGLPGQEDRLLDMGPQWLKYSDDRNQYLQLRQQAYAAAEPQGPGWDSLWNGEGHNQNALLTIFRHHDNAAVRKGLIGDLPLTTWVMDYPLFERSYYNLVVNFDVFGTVSHQAQTRLYFDLIRNGAEQNTLRYLPAELRQLVINHWYQKAGKLRLKISYAAIDTEHPSGITFHTATPVNEFNTQLLTRFSHINARPDPLNRCGGEHCQRDNAPPWLQQVDNQLNALASTRAAELEVVNQMPELTLIRVENAQGQREFYSLIRNRAHSNVAFMMGESLRYQPELDNLTLYPGILGSYPNFMFALKADQVAGFVSAMGQAEDDEDFTDITARYGVRRTHPEFWRYFHDITSYLQEHEPVEAGVLDMNRYQNL